MSTPNLTNLAVKTWLSGGQLNHLIGHDRHDVFWGGFVERAMSQACVHVLVPILLIIASAYVLYT